MGVVKYRLWRFPGSELRSPGHRQMRDPKDKLKPTKGDAVHTVIRAALSAVPVVGGPATELFSAIIAPPLARRRDDWMRQIADAVRELQDRIAELGPEKLSENESFVTTLIHASQLAVRNHQKEKLDALRNAVINAALPDAPDDDVQQMFLNFVDDLTPWHLRLLSFFKDPAAWIQERSVSCPSWSMGAPSAVVEHCFPELKGNRGFYDQLVRDLEVRGLLQSFGIHTTMTADGMFASRTTRFGDSFLKFICKPS